MPTWTGSQVPSGSTQYCKIERYETAIPAKPVQPGRVNVWVVGVSQKRLVCGGKLPVVVPAPASCQSSVKVGNGAFKTRARNTAHFTNV
jgi:hypothetical protein